MNKDYSRSKLAIFASYIKPHKKAFAIDMALSVGIALVDLIFPYVSRWSMRSLLPDGLYQAFFTVMVLTGTGRASCSRASLTTCLRSWSWRITGRRIF